MPAARGNRRQTKNIRKKSNLETRPDKIFFGRVQKQNGKTDAVSDVVKIGVMESNETNR